MSHSNVRVAGIVGIVTGLLGALAGIWLALVPPSVESEQFSYPLEAPAFVALQLAFVVQHVGLIVVVAGLAAAGVIGTRTGRVALVATIVSLVALTILEVVACFAAESLVASAEVDILYSAYGVVTVAIGAAAIVLGVSVARSSVWRGWRRWTALIVGVYAFVPLMPLMVASYEAARYAIGGWMLAFALLGLALFTAPAPRSDGSHSSSSERVDAASSPIGTR